MKRSLQTYAVSIQKGFRQLGMELVARETRREFICACMYRAISGGDINETHHDPLCRAWHQRRLGLLEEGGILKYAPVHACAAY